MRPDWRHTARLVTARETLGLRIRECLVRVPPGALPGGEFVLERLDAAGEVVDRRVLALEPAEAQAILDGGLAASLRALLEGRGDLPVGAEDAAARPTSAEAETPILRLG